MVDNRRISETEKKDVFEVLKEWLKLQKDMPYGDIKPKITIENFIPIKIEIKQGDKRVILTEKTVFD